MTVSGSRGGRKKPTLGLYYMQRLNTTRCMLPCSCYGRLGIGLMHFGARERSSIEIEGKVWWPEADASRVRSVNRHPSGFSTGQGGPL